MRNAPSGLDVLAIDPGDCMAVGDLWVATMLSTRVGIPGLGELVFDIVRADDAQEVTVERRWSALRCDLDQLARADGGSLMIGVPSPGSHVVEIQPPVQRGMFDDPFLATAGTLIDAFGLAYDQAIESGMAGFAVERHPESLNALTRLVEHVTGSRGQLGAGGGSRRDSPTPAP